MALRIIYKPNERVEPLRIDQRIANGETLRLAGDLRVLHAPGHCAGQVALSWQGARPLVAADVFISLFGPIDPIGFENAAAGQASQRKLAVLAPQAVCFGHGKALVREAAARLDRAANRW